MARERERGGGLERPNEWMQSSYHVEFFFIRHVLQGGHGRLGLPGAASHTVDQDRGKKKQTNGKSSVFKNAPTFQKCPHSPKGLICFPKTVFTFQSVIQKVAKKIVLCINVLSLDNVLTFKLLSNVQTFQNTDFLKIPHWFLKVQTLYVLMHQKYS